MGECIIGVMDLIIGNANYEDRLFLFAECAAADALRQLPPPHGADGAGEKACMAWHIVLCALHLASHLLTNSNHDNTPACPARNPQAAAAEFAAAKHMPLNMDLQFQCFCHAR